MTRLTLTLVALVALIAPAQTATARTFDGHPVSGPPRTITTAPAYITPRAAYYSAPVRLPTGDIDNAATLTAVRALHGATYSYLLYPKAGHNSARDWANLPAFLTLAARHHITVSVVLTPPSSTSSTAHPCTADLLTPYRGHYDQWITALGRLARHHPNLVEIGLDDAGYNITPAGACPVFTPSTFPRWARTLAHLAGRPITVRPVLYAADTHLRRTWVMRSLYAAGVRDITYPYWPAFTTTPLATQLAQIRAMYPGTRITVMVYAGGTYRGTTITPRLRAAMALEARRTGRPITYYQHPLTDDAR